MICPTCGKEFYSGNTCPRCGKLISAKYMCPKCRSAVMGNFCQNCGTRLIIPTTEVMAIPVVLDDSSDKSKWVAFFLCLFFGELGFHRFYVGKIGTGILWIFISLITFFIALWWVAPLIDIIFILTGNFKDKYGFYLR